MRQDEVEELYVAYLIIKATSEDVRSVVEKRALKYLKRIINKYGEGWEL